MYLNSLRLFQFRNFSEQPLTLASGVNILVGDNGSGKTNFVEAVSFLSLTRSFRTNKTRDLIQSGQQEMSVSGEFTTSEGTDSLCLLVERDKKKAFYNEKPVQPLSDFVGKILSVVFSPTDLLMVKGAPGERRRFLDRHISELYPRYLRLLLQYDRARRSKRVLLYEKSIDKRALLSWNEILAESSAEIMSMRRSFISDLQLEAQKYQKIFCPESESIEISLRETLESAKENNLSKERIYEEMESILPKEIERRKILRGPHRDDLRIFLGSEDARTFASQGQTRSLVLSLKYGVLRVLESKRGEKPILLLDDVDSELDKKRRDLFFEMLRNESAQVIITTTDERGSPKLFEDAEKVFQVQKGRILPL